MKIIFLIILLSSFTDLLSSVSIGPVRLSGLQWSVMLYGLLIYLMMEIKSISEVKKFMLFTLVTVYFIIRAYKSYSLFNAAVDINYMLLVIIVGISTFSAIKKLGDVERIENWILKSVFIPFIILIVAYISGVVTYVEGTGPKGVIGPRSISLYAVSVFALALSILFYNQVNKKKKQLALLSASLCILLIIVTTSRTAFLVSIVLMLVASILKFDTKKFKIGLLVSLLLITFSLIWNPMSERLDTEGKTFEQIIYGGGKFTGGRALFWYYSVNEGMKNPIWGKGTGNIKIFMSNLFYTISLPHNEYVRIFYDGGIVGLSLVTIAWVSRLRKHWKLWKEHDSMKNYNVAKANFAALLGTTAVLIAAFFSNTFLYVFMINIIFIIYGIADKVTTVPTLSE